MSQKTCVCCGGNELAEGTVQSTGRINFRLRNTKFLTLRTSDVSVQSSMCVRCGAIQLKGDVEKLRQVQAGV